MKCQDSRRLTGPNLQSPNPGAIAEVCFEPGDVPERLIALWRAAIAELESVISFSMGPLHTRFFDGGAALVCETEVDSLYSAVEANEWAIETANARFHGREGPSITAAVRAMEEVYDQERDSDLMALIQAARAREIPCLWDDDHFSVGYGRFSKTWERTSLPDVHGVPWTDLKAIPVVMVTGTNGKTTTARLAASILQWAGRTVGNSSTDGISVSGQVIESGDWTGPGAARAILRHTDVDVAVLEAARGGILRRGLGIEVCNAALVTNISADHLGDYGVLDCDAMAEAKGIVYRQVMDSGYRIVNVDDDRVRRVGLRTAETGLMAVSVHGRDAVSGFIDVGHPCFYYDGTAMVFEHGDHRESIMDVADMPLAQGGAALHNISNALGAMGLAWAVGAELDAMRGALSEFGRRWSDNPGRGQWTHIDGVGVLMDFGHNPHGVDAALRTAKGVLEPGRRLSVSIAQAGDRSDEDLQDLARAVAHFSPDRVVVRDLPEIYRRGRLADEVARILQDSLTDCGVEKGSIERAASEVDALKAGLAWARPGDLLVHLVHVERDAVVAHLASLGAPM